MGKASGALKALKTFPDDKPNGLTDLEHTLYENADHYLNIRGREIIFKAGKVYLSLTSLVAHNGRPAVLQYPASNEETNDRLGRGCLYSRHWADYTSLVGNSRRNY